SADALATLRRVREIYALDPGNLVLFHLEAEIVEIIRASAPRLLESPAYRDHAAAWGRMPPPNAAYVQGESIESLGRRIAKSGAEFAMRKLWRAAALQYDEAGELIAVDEPLAVARLE